MFKNFAKTESGAVTVDWVVLAGAVVAVAVGVVGLLQTGLGDAANTLNTNLNTEVNDASS